MKARAFWVTAPDGLRDLVLTFDPKFQEKHPGAEELSPVFKPLTEEQKAKPFMRMLKVKR